MAEHCNITYTCALQMDEHELAEANAALDLKEKEMENQAKKYKVKGGVSRRGRR